MFTYKKLKDKTAEELQREKNLKIWMEHHGKPTTRRQFLASGAAVGAASVVLPSALSMLASSEATAAACASAKQGGFVTLNLSGGASLAGNALALDKNGSFLSSYEAVGAGPTAVAAAAAVKTFGASSAAFAGVSGFMTGLLTKLTPATILNTNFLILCVRSQDDTANNPFDPTPMISVAKAGQGAFLPPLNKNRNQPAQLAAVPALSVNGLTSITDAIGVQGAVSNLSTQQKTSLFQMIQNLSSTQQAAFSSTAGYAMLTQLVQNATGTNVSLIGNASGSIDPRQNTALNTGNVWNFNNQTDLTNASVIYNSINGNAVTANLDMGGYDYHNQGRANMDTKDAQAGVLVGQALQTAANLGQKICVCVTSDGSVGHDITGAAGSPPTGDLGTHGMAYMFFYDPIGRHAQMSSQVGAFTGSGTSIGVDETTAIGSSASLATAAMVANYMAFLGQPDGINKVAPSAFNSTQLTSEIIKIG